MPLYETIPQEEAGEAVDLLRELIRLRSVNPPGNEVEVAGAIARWAEGRGLEAGLVSVAEDRPNVLVRLVGTGERPAVMLSGHTGTGAPGEGPWGHDAFSGGLEDGVAWGGGAVDMKGGVGGLVGAMAA